MNKRTLAAAAAAVALAIGAPGVANADGHLGDIPDDVEILGTAGDWTRFSGPYGFVYGGPDHPNNYGDSYYVIGNGSIADVCGVSDMPVPPSATGRIRERSDGRYRLADTVDEQLIYTTVYDIDPEANGIFDWFGKICFDINVNGAPVPEPVASGDVEISFNAVMDAPWWFTFADGFPQPTGRYENGLNGVVTTPDGQRMRLRAEVRYTVTDTGLDLRREYIKLKPTG